MKRCRWVSSRESKRYRDCSYFPTVWCNKYLKYDDTPGRSVCSSAACGKWRRQDVYLKTTAFAEGQSLMVLYGVSIQVSPVKAEWKLWPLTVRQLNILPVPSTLLPDKSPVTVWGSNLEPCKDLAWGMTCADDLMVAPSRLPFMMPSFCLLFGPPCCPAINNVHGNYLKQKLKTGFMLCVVLPVVPRWWKVSQIKASSLIFSWGVFGEAGCAVIWWPLSTSYISQLQPIVMLHLNAAVCSCIS